MILCLTRLLGGGWACQRVRCQVGIRKPRLTGHAVTGRQRQTEAAAVPVSRPRCRLAAVLNVVVVDLVLAAGVVDLLLRVRRAGS